MVLGLGVRPNSELAEAAGLELGARGARSRSTAASGPSVEGVWAAGDCAESFHLVSQRPVHVALGTVANRQGRVAGINIGGGYATFPGVVGTAITKVCSTEVGPHRSDRAPRPPATASMPWPPPSRARPAPATSPGRQPITVKLGGRGRARGRLLGGQIVGGDGAAKRIDTLAVAITAGMTAEDLLVARPLVRPAVLAGLGPGGHRGPGRRVAGLILGLITGPVPADHRRSQGSTCTSPVASLSEILTGDRRGPGRRGRTIRWTPATPRGC